MKKIGIISDTHSFWDDSFDKYFLNCDEIWHAGDIGDLKITDKLGEIAPLKGVYGNIDNDKMGRNCQIKKINMAIKIYIRLKAKNSYKLLYILNFLAIKVSRAP